MAYEASITNSSREFSKIEILDVTSFSDMEMVNDLDNSYILSPVTGWAQVHVHNDKCDTPDYDNLVLIVGEGETEEKYYTSSGSFTSSFLHIADVMKDEPYGIKIIRRESRNFKGKEMLDCKAVAVM